MCSLIERGRRERSGEVDTRRGRREKSGEGHEALDAAGWCDGNRSIGLRAGEDGWVRVRVRVFNRL